MKTILVVYVPVLHKGYLDLFLKESTEATELYIIGADVIAEFPELDYIKRKDAIRAIPEEKMLSAIISLNIFKKVTIMDTTVLGIIKDAQVKIIIPDEDISRAVASKYFSDKEVLFESVFLRWHSKNVAEKYKIVADCVISTEDFALKVMNLAVKESERSFDWWRQIGAIIVKDNEPILIAHNKHVPHEQMPYVNGDPRSIFKKGINIELSTASHAEATLIAEAAKRGTALEGTSLFVTDFPCPPCAKLVAESGIKKCYFSRGYTILDGESVMKNSGIELILVNTKNKPSV